MHIVHNDPFFLFCLRTGEVIDLAEIEMHELRWAVGILLRNQERLLTAIAVQVQADFHLSSIDDSFAAARASLGRVRPAPAPDGVVVSVLLAAGDDEGNWDFSEIPAVYFLVLNNIAWY